jgi:DNA-binding NtrC family response regulator
MSAVVIDSDDEARNFAGALVEEVALCVVGCICAASALTTLEWTADETVLVLADIGPLGETDGIELACLIERRWPWVKTLIQSSDPPVWHGRQTGTLFMQKPWLPLQVFIEAEKALDAARDFR